MKEALRLSAHTLGAIRKVRCFPQSSLACGVTHICLPNRCTAPQLAFVSSRPRLTSPRSKVVKKEGFTFASGFKKKKSPLFLHVKCGEYIAISHFVPHVRNDTYVDAYAYE